MKKLSLVALSVATLAGMLAVPSQVHAGADGLNDGTNKGDILGIAGSDTTYFVMNALSDAHNLSSRYNPDGDKAINIPPLVSANANVEAGESCLSTTNLACATTSWLKGARLAWPGGAVLPADAGCTTQYVFGGAGSVDTKQDGDINGTTGDDIDVPFTPVSTVPGGPSGSTYTVNLGVQPPNGSSDGRSAITGGIVRGTKFNVGGSVNGFECMDIARSSSYAAPSTTMELWAFALDAIGWTYFPGNSSSAVSNGLITEQLKNIYTCSAMVGVTPNFNSNRDYDANSDGDLYDFGDQKKGYPIIRYWNQLVSGSDVDGPEPAKIVPFRIQPGSGTGGDMSTLVLGSDKNKTDAFLDNCDGVGGVDKDGDTNTSFSFPITQEHDCRAVSTVDKPNAICWYGYSRWVLQARALETDKRNGAVFGKFGPTVSELKRPSFSSINETSTRYKGTRYVYNIIPQYSSSDVAGSSDARRFVGVSLQPAGCSDGAEGGADDCNFDGDKTDTVAGGTMTLGAQPGFVCGDATARRIIASFGFKPLSAAQTDAANADPGLYGTSSCRRNQIALSNS